jgi:hypothetical protein
MTTFILEFPRIPEREGPQVLRLRSPGPNRGALAELYRTTTGSSMASALALIKAGHGVLAVGAWYEMDALAKRYEALGAGTEIAPKEIT